MEIVSWMESADKDSKSFKKTDTINAIRPRPANSNRQFESCYHCGRSNHNAANCKFKEAQCHNCGKTGHIAPACRSKASHTKVPQTKSTPGQTKTHIKGKKTHHLQDDTQPPADENANSSEDEFGLHRVDTRSADPIIVSLSLNGQKLDMEVDTGAAFSVISEATKQALFRNKTLQSSNLVLKTYTDECMKVEDTLNVTVKYGNQTKKLMLAVVKGNEPSLLGRNWLKHIQLDWHNIFTIRTVKLKPLNSRLQQHETVFKRAWKDSAIHSFTSHKARCYSTIFQTTTSSLCDQRCHQPRT